MGWVLITILGLIIAVVVVFGIVGAVYEKKLHKRFDQFLVDHDGAEFLFYTNRENSRPFLETSVLPLLAPHVHVVLLKSRNLYGKFDVEMMSRMLKCSNFARFPRLMRISNGRVFSFSVHDELYSTLNGHLTTDDFVAKLSRGFEELRFVRVT